MNASGVRSAKAMSEGSKIILSSVLVSTGYIRFAARSQYNFYLELIGLSLKDLFSSW